MATETSITKTCTSCKQEKPLGAFYRQSSGKHGRTARCGECLKSIQLGYLRSRRDAQLRRKYGITLEQYEEILARQGGCCALCGRREQIRHTKGRPYSLAVDHCHETGKVRGVLCSDCNIGLGRFRDDVSLMRAAIDYVEAHRGR